MLQIGWSAELVKASTGTKYGLPVIGSPIMKRSSGGTQYDSAVVDLNDPGAALTAVGNKDFLRLYQDGVLQFNGYIVKRKGDNDKGTLQVEAHSAQFLLWKRFTRRWNLRSVNDVDVLRAIFDTALETGVEFEDLADWATAVQVAFSEGQLSLARQTPSTYYASGSLQSHPVVLAGSVRRARVDATITGQRYRVRTEAFGPDDDPSRFMAAPTAFLDRGAGIVRAPSAYTTPAENLDDTAKFTSMVDTMLLGNRLQLAGLRESINFETGAPSIPARYWARASIDNAAATQIFSATLGAGSARVVSCGSVGWGDNEILFEGELVDVGGGLQRPRYRHRFFTQSTETVGASTQLHEGGAFAGGNWETMHVSVYRVAGVLYVKFRSVRVGPVTDTAFFSITGSEAGAPTFTAAGDPGTPDATEIMRQEISGTVFAANTTTGGAYAYGALQIDSRIADFPTSGKSSYPMQCKTDVTKRYIFTCYGDGTNALFRVYRRTESSLATIGTGQGTYSLRVLPKAAWIHKINPESSQATVTFQLYVATGKTATFGFGNGSGTDAAYMLRTTAAGALQWRNAAGTWTSLATAAGFDQWNEFSIAINDQDANPANWSATVKFRGVDQGTITPRTTAGTGKAGLAYWGDTADATQDFSVDQFTTWPSLGTLPATTGTAIWKSPVLAFNVHYLDWVSLNLYLPTGATLDVEVSLDNGATWQAATAPTAGPPATPGSAHANISPSVLFALVRFTLTASPDGLALPTVDLLRPRIGAGYQAGTWVIKTLDLEPGDVLGAFMHILPDTVQATPAGTSIAYRGSSNGGANWTALPYNVETSIPPAERAQDVRVEISLTSTASATPYVDVLAVKYREVAGTGTVVVKVSRDNGTTFHTVTPGTWFDLEAFPAEDPENKFVLRFELATSDTNTTPIVEDARYHLESNGYSLVKLLDTIDQAKAAWPLREAAGLVAASIQEDAAPITLPVPGPTWLPAPFGGLSFPGTAAYHAIGAFGLCTAYPFTLHAWLKPSDFAAATRGAYGLGQAGQAVKGYAIGVKNGQVLLYAHDGTTDGSVQAAWPGLANDGSSFIHVEAVFTSAVSRELRINGRPMASSTVNVPFFLPDRAFLGALTATGANPWKGEVHYPVYHSIAVTQATGRLHGKGPGVWPLTGTYEKDFDADSRATALKDILEERGADAWWWLDPSTGIYYLQFGVQRPTPVVVDLPEDALLADDTDSFLDAERFLVSGA